MSNTVAVKNQNESVNINLLTKRDTTISILIIGVMFFVFGFVSWVNHF
ncbi:MAG: hypothetical protein JWQ14_2553 [Adhaeribacter sp.]|nr:hypothetical protein [Adhaeribacter sp.]